MEFRFNSLLLPLALSLSTGSVVAQEGAAFDASGAPAVHSSPARSTVLDKAAMIDVIVGVWREEGAHQVEPASGRTWEEALRARLETADARNLQRAMEALEFEDMLAALSGRSIAAGEGPQEVGDARSGLVFTPVTPCRILDTRVVGGPIPAATTRGFDVSAWFNGSFAFQGGSEGDCDIPVRPAAVAVNLAAVSPASAGYLTAFPYDAEQPLAATVNHPAGGVTSNEVLIPVSATAPLDMSVYSHRQAHVVGDIVGYYLAPEAMAPDCEVVETQVNVAAGTSEFRTATCAAGYVPQGGGCFWFLSEDHGPVVSFVDAELAGHTCRGTNQSASSQRLYARANCCRIPGR